MLIAVDYFGNRRCTQPVKATLPDWLMSFQGFTASSFNFLGVLKFAIFLSKIVSI